MKNKRYFGKVTPPYQDDPIYKLFKRDADRDICRVWEWSEKEMLRVIKVITDEYRENMFKKWRKK